jgi:hypothetical protein
VLRRPSERCAGPASLARGPREQAVGSHRVGHASRAKHFGAMAEPQQVEHALCTWAKLSPEAVLKLKFLFYFHFSFKLNSNFKNLYLNIQSSKNYEISSVGFIIF